MTGRLDNEHILVTGGGRGIGSAIVEKCLLEGANVSFIDIVGEEARSLHNKLSHHTLRILKTMKVKISHFLLKHKSSPQHSLINLLNYKDKQFITKKLM